MGQERRCAVDFNSRTAEGRALLETTELIFRGGFRLKIPFNAITKLTAADGKLTVEFPEGVAVFHLGAAAVKWAAKIQNPLARLDKLGVKAGTKYRVIGAPDEDFVRELAAMGASEVGSGEDLVFLHVESKSDLARIPGQGAPMWIIYPKGIQSITEKDVLAAGRAAGLVDIKVASFSPTHTALKFTVPAKLKK
jgi:hypothetical protein